MTPKQILDSFSETLIQDQRILSPQERDLLTTLLQHARAASGQSPETQQAVRSVIASAVGETVAQRAFSVLGASIVERILESSHVVSNDGSRTASDTLTQESTRQTGIYAGPHPSPSPEPQPPGARPVRGPKPPAPAPEPQPPGSPLRGPGPHPSPEPQPPGAKPVRGPHPPAPAPEPQPPGQPLRGPGPHPSPEPQPPGQVLPRKVNAETNIAVSELPPVLPARCAVLDEFLAPEELKALMEYTLERRDDFRTSEVVSPTEEEGEINYEHRRSRVLIDLGPHQSVMLDRIKSVLPQVLEKLGMADFQIAAIEAQVTASNDGDFFRFHSDNGSERVASRYLTFVYFFHREPRPFESGELRIHDARLEEGRYVSQGTFQTITPEKNQIVFFPCELLHEITPVTCPSRQFGDSRFTLNGWLRR